METPINNKHPGGRPPTYKTPEEMQEVIERYFQETKHPVILKDRVEYINGPYTMTGLALRLGFTSRQALLNYEGKSEFVDVIARARARVIEYAEGRLYDKDGARGAQFALENFNDDWTSRREIAQTNTNVLLVASPADAASLLSGMAGYFQAVERNVTPKPLEIEGKIDPIQ